MLASREPKPPQEQHGLREFNSARRSTLALSASRRRGPQYERSRCTCDSSGGSTTPLREGTQFTCFTGTNVQILTAEELRARLLSCILNHMGAASFTCFTSTKVQILTPEERGRPLSCILNHMGGALSISLPTQRTQMLEGSSNSAAS